MSNVFPFRDALSIYARAPVASVLPELRRFAVSIFVGNDEHLIEVLAFTSCDAVSNAIDAIFDGEDEMPTCGISIKVEPISELPRAA